MSGFLVLMMECTFSRVALVGTLALFSISPRSIRCFRVELLAASDWAYAALANVRQVIRNSRAVMDASLDGLNADGKCGSAVHSGFPVV